MKKWRTERQKEQTQASIEEAYNQHIGHTVLFNRHGIREPLAKITIVRSSYDRSLEGLKFWYKEEGEPFMKTFWHDQLKECLTCKVGGQFSGDLDLK